MHEEVFCGDPDLPDGRCLLTSVWPWHIVCCNFAGISINCDKKGRRQVFENRFVFRIYVWIKGTFLPPFSVNTGRKKNSDAVHFCRVIHPARQAHCPNPKICWHHSKNICQLRTLHHRSQIYTQACPRTGSCQVNTFFISIIFLKIHSGIFNSFHQISKNLWKQRLRCQRIFQRKYKKSLLAHFCTEQMTFLFFPRRKPPP